MPKIRDLEDLAIEKDIERGGSARGRKLQRRLAMGAGHPMRPDVAGEVKAYVNHGRWLARCPYCNGCEYVSEGTPFFCCSCGMMENDHRPMRVVFPDDRAEIEAVLEVRAAKHAHWTPDETVADLKKENKAHHLPVRKSS